MSDLPISYPVEPQVLDIQHDTDPAHDHGDARRIPHLGHAVLLFCLVAACVALCLLAVFEAAHLHTTTAMLAHPGLALAAQGAGYLLALAIAAWFFPLLWQRPFLDGISWNALAVVRRRGWILPGGVALCVVAQAGQYFLTKPKNAPIDDLLQNAHVIWITAVLAVVLGPVMEEIAFRGFLLPALATAYDWLTFPRTPAGMQRWRSTTAHTTPALVVATILSSIPFALMHAAQIGDAWGVVGILYFVSLVLSYVRIRTHSVACSTLMHAIYNFTIFALLFFSTDAFRHLDKISR